MAGTANKYKYLNQIQLLTQTVEISNT